MLAPPIPIDSWHHRYLNGEPYRPARGRYAPRRRLEDHQELTPWVVDLRQSHPDSKTFVRAIARELRIRFYGSRTVAAYRRCVVSFLRWLGLPPHQATREHLRNYLELLVDGKAGASRIAVMLAAIRTCFDKMCGQNITLGLALPRRPSRLPVVLSQPEVLRLLQGAPSLRDKLLLGLMYGTGSRVSEVVRLRWRDFDFDRGVVMIWEGKGRKDRQVMLPESFRPLLQPLSRSCGPEAYVFPTHNPSRHLSPRTAQRVMARAMAIAGIHKQAGPHSLRHAYACHLLEHGTDIRFIQRFLGHRRLETTTLYTRVAQLPKQTARSPLDLLAERAKPDVTSPPNARAMVEAPPVRVSQPVVRLRFEIALTPPVAEGAVAPGAEARVHLVGMPQPLALSGIQVAEPRPGWVTINVPPTEAWEDTLRWLEPKQRERLEEPAFFALLQMELSRRFLQARADAAPATGRAKALPAWVDRRPRPA